jgi:hypothetical protein
VVAHTSRESEGFGSVPGKTFVCQQTRISQCRQSEIAATWTQQWYKMMYFIPALSIYDAKHVYSYEAKHFSNMMPAIHDWIGNIRSKYNVMRSRASECRPVITNPRTFT